MILDNIHIDNAIKFEYAGQNTSTVTDNNVIGVTADLTKRTLSFTPSDTTTIYVSKSGSDSNPGTLSLPVLTIKRANDLLTSSKVNIVILDSETYLEDSLVFSSYLQNICASIGQTPVINNNLIPSNTNFSDNTFASLSLLTSVTTVIETVSVALTNGNTAIVYRTQGSFMWFQIIDKDGDVVVAETEVNSAGSALDIFACAVGNNFVIAYTATYPTIHVYNNSGESILTQTAVAGNYTLIGITPTTEGHIALFLQNGSSAHYFRVVSISGTVVTNYTAFTSCAGTNGLMKGYPRVGGGFICTYASSASSVAFWAVVNSSGSILHESTSLSYTYASIAYKPGDTSIIFLSHLNGTSIGVSAFNASTYASETGISIDALTGTPTHINLIPVDDNFAIISLWGSTNYNTIIISKNAVIKQSFEGLADRRGCSYNPVNLRFTISGYSSSGNAYIGITIIGGFLTDWWTFSSSVELNGINFTSISDYVRKYISAAGDEFTVKWCDFRSIERNDNSDGSYYPLKAINSTATANTLSNCAAIENDSGFYFTSNDVTVSYNQFYKHLSGNAVYIDGAGTNIIIKNNDFLYNLTGVELENNDGTEVLKNNIFTGNVAHSIEAETSVTYSNSIDVDEVLNVVDGTSIIRSNPLFKNDGVLNIDLLNLHLRSIFEGYSTDSPALLLGDDGYDAGCYNTTVSAAAITYTTVYIPKPKKINIKFSPVNEVFLTMQDGSIDSRADSWQLSISLEWDTVKAIYAKDLAKMIISGGEIRTYFSPYTYESLFETYKIKYTDYPFSNDLYSLAEYGFKDFKLNLVRKMDVEEILNA